MNLNLAVGEYVGASERLCARFTDEVKCKATAAAVAVYSLYSVSKFVFVHNRVRCTYLRFMLNKPNKLEANISA